MSSTFSKSGESTVAHRFKHLLRGRSATPWAEWVGISQGTLGRLKNGSLPDPELLTAACRAENLSLTWLLDAIGPPYLVMPTAGTEDAIEAVRLLKKDEPHLESLLVMASAGSSIVLHQQAAVAIKNGTCDYRAVTIVGGNYDAFEVIEAMRIDDENTLRMLRMERADWHRLANGRMGSTELFGWGGREKGLFESATRYSSEHLLTTGATITRLADDRGTYRLGPLMPWQREVIDLLEELDESARAVALRMLRGLKP